MNALPKYVASGTLRELSGQNILKYGTGVD
jgi:hypothetical protein